MFSTFKKYPRLSAAFSQKIDGSMKLTDDSEIRNKILRNWNAFFLKNNIDPAKVVSAEITHGNRVETVRRDNEGKIIGNADGLITQNKDVYLSITSADCLPIFLFEPRKEIVGMIHAGWRSLAENILASATDKILELGGKPKNTLISIGPAICQNHYEVGPEVAQKFEKYPEAMKKVSPRLIRLGRKADKLFLDIKKIAQLQLLELGFQKESIEISSECTFELPEKYFSARRDRKKEVEAMIALIGIKK